MSPGVALGYLFWTRHRRGLTILAGYLLVVVIFCRIVLGGNFTSALDEHSTPAVVVYTFLAVFLLFFAGLAAALAYLLCIFSFSREVRLEVRESGFPSRLLHLPLPTPALTGWPMLWGSITLVLGWLTLAWGALRPCGFNGPLGWPALLLAVVLAWLQAIVWTPFPLPWVRALLFIPLSSVFVLIFCLAFNVSTVIVYTLLAVLLPAGYLAAIHGVSRARRGENGHWSWPAWLRWTRPATPTRQPFASVPQAQLWFEWRRCGLAFPVAMAACALTLLPLISFIAASSRHDFERLLLLIIPPNFSLLLASGCGVEMGRLAGRERGLGLSSFLATRPLSVAMLSRAKFEAAALSSLAGWAVTWAGLLFWLALVGHGTEIAVQFAAMRQRYPAGRLWASLVVLVVGSLVLIWMQMAGHLWAGLMYRVDGDHQRETHFLQRAGNLWVRLMRQVWGINVILGTIAVSVLIVVGRKVAEPPGPWQAFADLLPWLAGGAIALKSLAAVWSLSRLKRNALVPSHVLIGMLTAWGALAIGLFVVLRWLIPREVVPTSGLILGIVLLLPLTRLALAPLALAWNRHR